jgi:ribulose-phosphate 3-epimerase
MTQVKIIPAILAKTFAEFKKQAKVFEKNFSLAQIDVMDNQFVKNKTFYDLKKIQNFKTSLNYELHLMVKKPLGLIEKWKNFRKVKRIIFHLESLTNNQIEDLLRKYQKSRIEIGLAINPRTSLKKFIPFKNKVGYVLLMAVQPGFGGQKLRPKVYGKIKELRKLNRNIIIGVDGGVNETNSKELIGSGAKSLNVAGYLLHASDQKQAINNLLN